MEGWISLHRKFLEWEWFTDDKMVKLFIYLLLKANRKDGFWKGIKVKRGELLTGILKLSSDTGITKQSLRTCLKRLKLTKEIYIKSTNKYSIITICNYDSYQKNNTTTNKQLTSNQQTTNKQSTTNNTYNKEDTLNTDINKYKKELLSGINPDDYNLLNSEYIEIAKSYQFLFIKNQNDAGIKNSTLSKAKGTWIDDIRLLIENDEKTIEQCRIVFEFLSSNNFWKSNILSTKKLREKFDTLLIQSKSNSKNKSTKDQEIYNYGKELERKANEANS